MSRVTSLIMLGAQLLALALTFSRAGIGASLLAMGLFYILSAPTMHIRLSRLFALSLIFAGLFMGIPASGLTELNPQRFSFDVNLRDEAWKPLLQSIWANPVHGVGFGGSYEVLLEPLGLEISGHSAHLQTIAELGFIGYALFLAIAFLPIIFARSQLRSCRDDQHGVIIAAFSICSALLIHQLFEGSLLRYGFHTLFWAYLLFLLVHPAWEERKI
ncbi:O-antigen ligase family protein [Moorellaceae bacterium AZ2]